MTALCMTEAEYLKKPADYRGIWTTERTDWKDWDQVRHQYMGKRTLMVFENGAASLVIEGMGLDITPNEPLLKIA